jgi:Calcium binding
MKSTKRKPRTAGRTRAALSAAKLAEMIEEATVDAYGECEQATGWFTVIGDNLDMPFETEVLGVAVTVKRLQLLDDNSIVAVCARGAIRQAIRVVDLPLPSPKPEGAEWIEAYRHWLGGDAGASFVGPDPWRRRASR